MAKELIFDDKYTGIRYRYGLTYRPLDYGTIPEGFIIYSNKPHPGFQFGTIDYPRPLTEREIESYQLTFVGTYTK